MYKHKRKNATPNEIFKSPITYGQEYGSKNFEEGRNLNNIHRPIRKCPETKFSEFMIKTGKNFL